MDIEFSSIDELKKRLLPALKIRRKDLKNKGINISIEDLWTYFVGIWKNRVNLTLNDLVNDILYLEIKKEEEVI